MPSEDWETLQTRGFVFWKMTNQPAPGTVNSTSPGERRAAMMTVPHQPTPPRPRKQADVPEDALQTMLHKLIQATAAWLGPSDSQARRAACFSDLVQRGPRNPGAEPKAQLSVAIALAIEPTEQRAERRYLSIGKDEVDRQALASA